MSSPGYSAEILKRCLAFLARTRGWDSSENGDLTKQCKSMVENTSSDFPDNWHLPLVAALESGNLNVIKTVVSALSDIYCADRTQFGRSTDILRAIGAAVSKFSRETCAGASYLISRFCLGVINEETSKDSAVHGDVLLQYFHAIFECAIWGSDSAAKFSSEAALMQAVQTIGRRFECPPCFETETAVVAYQVSREICFKCISRELFDILDNSAAIPPLDSVYEGDVLIILKSLCSGSLGLSEGLEGEYEFKKARYSIDLVTALVAMDEHVLHTSLRYLQLIKNMACSLILRHCHTTSFPLFQATLFLCQSIMTKYKDILKAENSVFFSSFFFRILDHQAPPSYRSAVLKTISSFSPAFLAEIFVNFDCDSDLQEANVFEHLINSLMNLSDDEEALHCLATIIKNLDTWSSEKLTDTKITTQIDETRKLRAKYTKAIDEFNADPIHGVNALVESGLVKDDPKNVADFLRSHRSLVSPTAVGLALGSTKPFFKRLMHEYIDSIDFDKMSLCEGLYAFLSMFRLPPESQQISRILEKFAHSYYIAHQDEYPSASIVYDAAFAAVILHTDAHNVHVKDKMQKNEFVKLYQDMDEGDALPISTIEAIYDYVVTHEISLQGTSESVTLTEDFRSPAQKGLDAYKQSIEHIREAQKRMRNSTGSEVRWVCPVNPDTVRSIFDAIWMPLNALATKILGDGHLYEAISDALTILTSSISISARFYMETESTFCMSSLCVFTRLQPWTPINIENIRAIRELLDMSTSFSSYFEPVWEKMLSLFAQLNYFVLANNTCWPGDPVLEEISRNNAALIADYIPTDQIDALFERSASFPSTAIVPFVHALCKVSNNEFAQRPPRTFCLQKIVEVTSFNMERARFVWTQIWKPISQHLVEAGCFPQEVIARTALDSLRQLAGKFLAREELKAFHYQRDFLKPFHLILRKSKSKPIRLHSLRCLNYTVNRYHANMKSGWETVFSMLESAATITEVNRLSLTVLIDIFERHLPSIIEEHLIPQAMKAVAKYIIVGRSIRASAVFVTVGVFERMMTLDVAEDDLKPVLSALSNLMNDANTVLQVLPVIAKAMVPKYWVLLAPFIQKVFQNKTEKWYKRAGSPLAEWAVSECADACPDAAVELILQCVRCENPRVLSICVQALTSRLSHVTEAKSAAKRLSQGILASMNDDVSDASMETLSALIVDLAAISDLDDLISFAQALKGPAKKLPIAARALLAVSIALFTKGKMESGELVSMCMSLFESTDEGKRTVVEELMKLEDENFIAIAKELSVEAAKLISTDYEPLRKSLTAFFVRMSRDCFSDAHLL